MGAASRLARLVYGGIRAKGRERIMLTVGFSEARQNLTEIANRVVNEGAEYTVFKRSKPLFKIVPVSESVLLESPVAEKVVPCADIPRSRQETEAYYAHRQLTAEPRLLHPEIPDGGEALFEYVMALRARTPRSEFLENLTVEGIKEELGKRDE